MQGLLNCILTTMKQSKDTREPDNIDASKVREGGAEWWVKEGRTSGRSRVTGEERRGLVVGEGPEDWWEGLSGW